MIENVDDEEWEEHLTKDAGDMELHQERQPRQGQDWSWGEVLPSAGLCQQGTGVIPQPVHYRGQAEGEHV